MLPGDVVPALLLPEVHYHLHSLADVQEELVLTPVGQFLYLLQTFSLLSLIRPTTAVLSANLTIVSKV